MHTYEKKLFRLNAVKKKMIAGFVLLTLINVITFLVFQIISAYALLGGEVLDKSYAYAKYIEKIISPIGIYQTARLQNKITNPAQQLLFKYQALHEPLPL